MKQTAWSSTGLPKKRTLGRSPKLSTKCRTNIARMPGSSVSARKHSFLASVLLPAVHGLVSAFAAKFFEGAASASGKAAVEALKDKVAKSFTPDADPAASQAAIADLDRRLARRAKELGQPGSSYQDVLHYLRNNPKILL
jgi:hypothetical protein